MSPCAHCGAPAPDDARFCPKCGTAIVRGDADPLLGQTIADRYRLVEKIGQGGSGTIYRAEHATLRKRVAVKILHQQLAGDDTALERFRREATTVAELDNDHILQVLDFGRADDGRLFFAMEFLEGEPLSKVIERDHALPIPRAVDILTQLAEALMEAHGLGYVHRDLRPRNVFLINRRGRADFVKLLDFGLAKLVSPDAKAAQTAMGMTFGDPRYMSPEQAKGDALDRRSDIYSLGAIAFEMLTGAPPYQGSGVFDILQQHLDAPVPQVHARRTDCPPWLDAIVQRALAKRPEGRFPTVLKLLEPLRAQSAPPPLPDAAEQAEHAKLAATGPTAPTPPVIANPPAPVPVAAPAPIHDMGPPSVTAQQPIAAKSAKETLALSAREVKAAAKAAQKKNKKNAAATSGAVEATPVPQQHAVIPDVPSVVVESGPHDVTQQQAVVAPTKESRKSDPTSEWFANDSQPVKTLPELGYDDLDEPPKKNKGPMIIAAVAGGLSAVLLAVFLLLPKPEHKPTRAAVKPVPASPPTATATPTPPPPTPTPPPAPPSTAAAATPTPPTATATQTGTPTGTGTTTTTTTPTPTPTVAAKPAPPPPAAAPPPKPVEPPKAAVVEKAPERPVEKPPVKAAVVEKAAPPAKAPVEKPAKAVVADSSSRKHEKASASLKDPYPAKSSAPAGEAAQAEFFIKLGRQKLSASDLAAAAANFNKAREYDAKSSEAVAGLGEVAFEQGDYNGAAVHLKQALRLSPNRSRYLVLLGQTYYKLGKSKEAVAEYKRALKIDPHNQEAQHSLEVAERKLSSGG